MMRFVCGMLTLIVFGGTALADKAPLSRELVLDDRVKTVVTHPDRLVYMVFPSRIRSVECSDDNYGFEANENRLKIQPFANASAIADLIVTLEGHTIDASTIQIHLRRVELSEEVVARIALVPPGRHEKEDRPEAALGQMTRDVVPSEDRENALARRLEGRVGGVFGRVSVSEPEGNGEPNGAYFTGAAVSLGLRHSRHVSSEASLTLGRITPLRFSAIRMDGARGEIVRPSFLGRILVGGKLHTKWRRFAVAARAAAGMQGRTFIGSRIHFKRSEVVVAAPVREAERGLVASVGVSVDVRVARAWMIGAATDGISALVDDSSFKSVEAGVYVRWLGW